MSTNDTEWAGSDAEIASALLAGHSYDSAAEVARCSRSTIARRMADRAFRSRLDSLRREALTRTTDRLAAEALASVTVLAELRDSAKCPPGVRARAARDVLDFALRYVDATELAARVEALEESLAERKQGRR